MRLGDSVEVTLISRDNFLLFTPFLTEAMGGMLDEADVISHRSGRFSRKPALSWAKSPALTCGRRQ